MDADSFIIHANTDYILKDIPEYFETRFGTSYYELNRPFPKGKTV